MKVTNIETGNTFICDDKEALERYESYPDKFRVEKATSTEKKETVVANMESKEDK